MLVEKVLVLFYFRAWQAGKNWNKVQGTVETLCGENVASMCIHPYNLFLFYNIFYASILHITSSGGQTRCHLTSACKLRLRNIWEALFSKLCICILFLEFNILLPPEKDQKHCNATRKKPTEICVKTSDLLAYLKLIFRGRNTPTLQMVHMPWIMLL